MYDRLVNNLNKQWDLFNDENDQVHVKSEIFRDLWAGKVNEDWHNSQKSKYQAKEQAKKLFAFIAKYSHWVLTSVLFHNPEALDEAENEKSDEKKYS